MNIELINENFPYLFPFFAFIFGSCVGSFLNVCIYRIPQGKSIVKPASRCKCGAPIKAYHNIPILGWIILKGKATCCNSKISARYPIVEFLTASIFCLMWILFPMYVSFVGMTFAFILIFCTFVDLDTMTLPDFATVGGTFLGFILAIAVPDTFVVNDGQPFIQRSIFSAIASLLGIIIASGLMYWVRLLGEIIFKKEAMGEADIILLACIGSFCGWQGAIFALFAGSLIGSVVIIPLFIIAKILGKNFNPEIPFGPWLAIGGLIYFLFNQHILALIVNMFSIN